MNRQITRMLLYALLCVPLLAATGCRRRDYNGTWQGTTSQDKPISFTVENGRIKKVSLNYRMECTRGGFCPLEARLESEVSAEDSISGDAIRVKLSNDIEVKGSFTSGTDASGEMKILYKRPPCECHANATWNVKKQ